MTAGHRDVGHRVAAKLIRDELFDLSLYRTLRDLSGGRLRAVLDDLIPIETRHVAFWQEFFGMQVSTLDIGRRLKLRVIVALCRVFGERAVHLVLEAIEVYGVRKYLALWDAYRDGPVGDAVRQILEDEFGHEDRVVQELTDRKINPEAIRNIFLGLNDGLVEMLGAVSGFFGAFARAETVLVAAFTVAVAGSVSMGAGAYVAMSSEEEVRGTELAKRRFLGEGTPPEPMEQRSTTSALVVGASYFVGALVPVLPVLLGARSLLFPVVTAGSMIVAVSLALAFLSGMDIRRRVAGNVVIMGAAVAITYALGSVAREVWGLSL